MVANWEINDTQIRDNLYLPPPPFSIIHEIVNSLPPPENKVVNASNCRITRFLRVLKTNHIVIFPGKMLLLPGFTKTGIYGSGIEDFLSYAEG